MKKLLTFAGSALAGIAAFAEGEVPYAGFSNIAPDFNTAAGSFLNDVGLLVQSAMPIVLSIAGCALGIVVISLVWRAVTRFLGRA